MVIKIILPQLQIDLTERTGRYTDTTAANNSGPIGATGAFIASITQQKNDFTPTNEVIYTSFMVWYDFVVIALATVFESLSKIGILPLLELVPLLLII